MRYLMVIWADRDRANQWQMANAEQQDVEAVPLHDWYETHSAAERIRSGAEAAWPRDAIVVRASSSGPVVEYGGDADDSVLSGVMVIEVDSVETATDMARTWPDLRAPGDRIDLIPIRDYDQP